LNFNASLDAVELLTKMGYTAEAIYQEDELIRVFCPIHKDQVRRSLIINPNERTYICQYTSCPGHDGGALIELYAIFAEIDIATAMVHLGNSTQVDQVEESDLLNQAQDFIENGKYSDAEPLLNKCREINPTNAITRCKLASLYLEQGRRNEGKKEYLAAAEDFGVLGELEKTLSIYNLLIILSPQDMKVRQQLAYLFARLGKAEDAVEHLKWVVDVYLNGGQIDEAATMCEQMVELTPDEPLIHQMLGDIMLENGMINEAMPSYENAGNLFYNRNDFENAQEVVSKGLKYVPGSPALVELRDRLAEAEQENRPSLAEMAREQEGDDDFADWIASLEDEIDKPAAPQTSEDEIEISPQDERVHMCRNSLDGLDNSQMTSMENFLRDMFIDVKNSYDKGTLTPTELRVIKEFYTSFCVAFEQQKRNK